MTPKKLVTITSLCLLTLTAIGLLWFRYWYVPRNSAASPSCLAQLKQIQGANEMYALENKLTATNRISISDVSGGADKFIRPLINAELVCPQGGTYSITTVGEPPRCSVQGHSLPEDNL